jgi:hypothetical protein
MQISQFRTQTSYRQRRRSNAITLLHLTAHMKTELPENPTSDIPDIRWAVWRTYTLHNIRTPACQSTFLFQWLNSTWQIRISSTWQKPDIQCMTHRQKRSADFRTGVLLTPQRQPKGYNQDTYVVGRTTLNHRIHILPISKVAKYLFYLTN